ncbi:TaqI family restriction endonuclease [Mycoplasma sp. 4423]
MDNAFNEFLESINLDLYRSRYKNIKIMEADMPKEIQALDAIYQVYWNNNNFLDFDDWYLNYYLTDDMKAKILNFNKNHIGLCECCLFKGIEARIYRTWASIITQIQAGYCCQRVFGKENVFQSSDLDRNGIDILIDYKGVKIGIQIKKETGRKEIRNRISLVRKQSIVNKVIDIYYTVITDEQVEKCKYVKKTKEHNQGDYKDYAYLYGLNGDSPYLQKLSNGFVIFTLKYFQEIKDLIDNKVQILYI